MWDPAMLEHTISWPQAIVLWAFVLPVALAIFVIFVLSSEFTLGTLELIRGQSQYTGVKKIWMDLVWFPIFGTIVCFFTFFLLLGIALGGLNDRAR